MHQQLRDQICKVRQRSRKRHTGFQRIIDSQAQCLVLFLVEWQLCRFNVAAGTPYCDSIRSNSQHGVQDFTKKVSSHFTKLLFPTGTKRNVAGRQHSVLNFLSSASMTTMTAKLSRPEAIESG